MKIILAPDSLKGNITADEACSIMKSGIHKIDPTIDVISIPMADGGEGTSSIITKNKNGRFIEKTVTGPLGAKVNAKFGLIDDDTIAVIDMASASGLPLIPYSERNPLKTTSFGTGELIKAALDLGVKSVYMGIGGSATNDGGVGMLSALGFRFLDKEGTELFGGGEILEQIKSMDTSHIHPRLGTVSFLVACDCTNPLTGEKGASAVYGPQKGATPEMIKILDAGLTNLGEIWAKSGLTDNVMHPGDGAAGGLGAALRICLGGKIVSGTRLVMECTQFQKHLDGADLVITCEGKADSQTKDGKLCSVVAKEAKEKGVPVILLAGAIDGDPNEFLQTFHAAASFSAGQESKEEMIRDSKRDLEGMVMNVIRMIQIGFKVCECTKK